MLTLVNAEGGEVMQMLTSAEKRRWGGLANADITDKCFKIGLFFFLTNYNLWLI